MPARKNRGRLRVVEYVQKLVSEPVAGVLAFAVMEQTALGISVNSVVRALLVGRAVKVNAGIWDYVIWGIVRVGTLGR
jgi:hypothetical protein